MKTFREFIFEANDAVELHESKPTDKQATQDAAKFGFKPTGKTSAHRVQYADESGNTVYFSKTTSDRKAYQNFKAQMKRAQRSNSPQPTAPVEKPVRTKPSEVSIDARRRYRKGLNVTRVPANQQQSSFSQLPKPSVSKPVAPKPTTTTQPSLIQRMSSAYSRLVRGLSSTDKATLGNKALTQVTGAGSKGLRYVPNVNKPVPARGGGGGGAFSMVQPIDTPISPGYSDAIQNYARSRATRMFNRRGGV